MFSLVGVALGGRSRESSRPSSGVLSAGSAWEFATGPTGSFRSFFVPVLDVSPKLIFVCGMIDRVSKVDLGPRREFRGTTGISVELTLLQDVSLQFQLLWCVVARDIACCVLRVMLCFVAGSPVVQRGPLAHTAPIALSAPAQTVLPVWKNSVLPVLCCAVVSDAASLGVGRCYVLSGAW